MLKERVENATNTKRGLDHIRSVFANCRVYVSELIERNRLIYVPLCLNVLRSTVTRSSVSGNERPSSSDTDALL